MQNANTAHTWEADFRGLLSRPPSEEERARLLALDADDWFLVPLVRCLAARAKRRRVSRIALTGSVLLVVVGMALVDRRGGAVGPVSLALGASLAGLVLAGSHLLLGHMLDAREREAVRIERMAHRGAIQWIDEYARWLESAPHRSGRWKWLALPCGLAFLVALALRGRPGLSETSSLLLSVVGIVGAYTCLRVALQAHSAPR